MNRPRTRSRALCLATFSIVAISAMTATCVRVTSKAVASFDVEILSLAPEGELRHVLGPGGESTEVHVKDSLAVPASLGNVFNVGGGRQMLLVFDEQSAEKIKRWTVHFDQWDMGVLVGGQLLHHGAVAGQLASNVQFPVPASVQSRTLSEAIVEASGGQR